MNRPKWRGGWIAGSMLLIVLGLMTQIVTNWAADDPPQWTDPLRSAPAAYVILAILAVVGFVIGVVRERLKPTESPEAAQHVQIGDGISKPPILALSAASGGDGKIDLFVVAGDRLFYVAFDPDRGPALIWRHLELPHAGAWRVAATRISRYHLECFVVDLDGEIWTARMARTGSWSRWTQVLFGTEIDAIAVSSLDDNHRELFVVTRKGELHHRWGHGTDPWRGDGELSQWAQMLVPGRACRDVAAAVSKYPDSEQRSPRHPSVIDCFVLTTRSELLHSWWPTTDSDPSWSKWETWERPTEESVPRKISAYRGGESHQEVFVIGPQGRLHHRWQDNGPTTPWTDWNSEAPPQADDYVVAAGYTSDHEVLHCFAGGTDGTLWESTWSRRNGTWARWHQLRTSFVLPATR